MSDRGCSHLNAIAIESIKQPQRRECEECVKIGSYWVHLRTCQACGVTLCCDSSPNIERRLRVSLIHYGTKTNNRLAVAVISQSLTQLQIVSFFPRLFPC